MNDQTLTLILKVRLQSQCMLQFMLDSCKETTTSKISDLMR